MLLSIGDSMQQLPFYWTGTVIPGQNKGHTIGFPTANLDQIPHESELKPGVYVGYCWLESQPQPLRCLPYFGPRFVAGETINVFEVYIYDFNQQIYGNQLRVELQKFVRPPIEMKTFAELKQQLEQDKQQGLQYFQDE